MQAVTGEPGSLSHRTAGREDALGKVESLPAYSSTGASLIMEKLNTLLEQLDSLEGLGRI
jgi:hypothetical protein